MSALGVLATTLMRPDIDEFFLCDSFHVNKAELQCWKSGCGVVLGGMGAGSDWGTFWKAGDILIFCLGGDYVFPLLSFIELYF